MQTKGVVMQVAEGYAVVMTKNCEFRKIPLIEGMALGQEVDLPAETIVPLPQKKACTWYKNSWMKTGMVAASLLLAVGLWTGSSLFSGPKAYAYVSLDINPSIELSIDQDKKVVSVTPLNTDAKTVLSEVQLTGLSVDQAVGKVADIARSHGYLHDKSEVIITASPAIEEEKLVKHNMNLEQLEGQLVEQVKTLATTYGTEVEVEGIRVSDQVRTAAQDAGVSPGKYALYLAARSNGIDVDINELKTQPISKIVDQRGTQLAEVLHDLKGGEQLDGLLKQYKNDSSAGKQNSNAKPAVVPNNNKLPERDEKPAPPGQTKKDGDPTNDTMSSKGSGNAANSNKGQANGRENGNGNGKDHVGSGNLNWNMKSNGNGGGHNSDDKGSDHRGHDWQNEHSKNSDDKNHKSTNDNKKNDRNDKNDDKHDRN